ncbi:MAG: hypothetical protein JSR93_09550 [Verrucomicrobia bacterium]|nr:hypothetical protein [Verrucomicrobiota bacterium]
MNVGYWICWILLPALFLPLIFRWHKKNKVVARDTFINIFIYLFIYLTLLPPFKFEEKVVYVLLIAACLLILLVNCILNRMNKSMLVVCFILLQVMAASSDILYPQTRENPSIKKQEKTGLHEGLDSKKNLTTKRQR